MRPKPGVVVKHVVPAAALAPAPAAPGVGRAVWLCVGAVLVLAVYVWKGGGLRMLRPFGVAG
jgi:hypothetical protein